MYLSNEIVQIHFCFVGDEALLYISGCNIDPYYCIRSRFVINFMVYLLKKSDTREDEKAVQVKDIVACCR